MKKIFYVVFVVLAAATMLFGCANNKKKETRASIGKGKVMNLTFDANPTTGFVWEYSFASGDNIGELVTEKEEYVSSNTDKNLVGAGGKMYYSFRATKPGKQNILFVYRRPWEGGETAYDVIYELDIDNDLNISVLSKMKGNVNSEKELTAFPDPVFSE